MPFIDVPWQRGTLRILKMCDHDYHILRPASHGCSHQVLSGGDVQRSFPLSLIFPGGESDNVEVPNLSGNFSFVTGMSKLSRNYPISIFNETQISSSFPNIVPLTNVSVMKSLSALQSAPQWTGAG